jgi:phosphoribosylaminoimidazolecarboxamide formyltransferase/IMP cyclohydrolase
VLRRLERFAASAGVTPGRASNRGDQQGGGRIFMLTHTRVRRALLSVSDKIGIVDFARVLRSHGVEILSTGGTARALRDAGVEIREVGEFTGFPELLDGRVKTLHPRIHAGILFRRDLPGHVATMAAHDLPPIDLVAVNLYPFEETIARTGATWDAIIEQIDIGGPSMVRSAAKNHDAVTIATRPEHYPLIASELAALGGSTSLELRRRLARDAFRRTADYDRAIAAWLEKELDDEPCESGLAPRLDISLARARHLRYGENPAQRAALYGSFLERFEQIHGKELSYNNLLDLAGAIEVAGRIARYDRAACAIIKHSNPCGAAVALTLDTAWRDALSTDPASASGGIIAVTVPVDEAAALAMADHFIEILVAPSYTPAALEILRRKKQRILLVARDLDWVPRPGELWLRSVPGGVLVQDADAAALSDADLKVVTRRAPSDDELRALRFAHDVATCVKSNAIVYTSATRTLGVGAGQMSRVDSARIAAMKAKEAGIDLRGAVVASDAFFPFSDGLLVCVDAGASAVIQPGGSVRDEDVIRAADERGIAMVFTGKRHFRH